MPISSKQSHQKTPLDCISNPTSPNDVTLKPFPPVNQDHLGEETIQNIIELADQTRFGLKLSFFRNGVTVDQTVVRNRDYYDVVKIFRIALAILSDRDKSETPIYVIVQDGRIRKMAFKWSP